MLETGAKRKTEVVCSDAAPPAMGSGTLDVLLTPAMTALMEKTAWMSGMISSTRAAVLWVHS